MVDLLFSWEFGVLQPGVVQDLTNSWSEMRSWINHIKHELFDIDGKCFIFEMIATEIKNFEIKLLVIFHDILVKIVLFGSKTKWILSSEHVE